MDKNEKNSLGRFLEISFPLILIFYNFQKGFTPNFILKNSLKIVIPEFS